MRKIRVAYRLGFWCVLRGNKLVSRHETEREARAAARGMGA